MVLGQQLSGTAGDGTQEPKDGSTKILDGVITVSMNDHVACAAMKNGDLQCWGDNYAG